MGPFSNSIYLWTQLRQQTRNQSTQEGRLSPTNFWKMPKLVWKAYKLWMADRYERNWLAANHRPTKHPRQPCHAILWAKTLAKNAFGVGSQVTWRLTAKTSLFRNHVRCVPWRITRWEPVHWRQCALIVVFRAMCRGIACSHGDSRHDLSAVYVTVLAIASISAYQITRLLVWLHNTQYAWFVGNWDILCARKWNGQDDCRESIVPIVAKQATWENNATVPSWRNAHGMIHCRWGKYKGPRRASIHLQDFEVQWREDDPWKTTVAIAEEPKALRHHEDRPRVKIPCHPDTMRLLHATMECHQGMNDISSTSNPRHPAIPSISIKINLGTMAVVETITIHCPRVIRIITKVAVVIHLDKADGRDDDAWGTMILTTEEFKGTWL